MDRYNLCGSAGEYFSKTKGSIDFVCAALCMTP